MKPSFSLSFSDDRDGAGRDLDIFEIERKIGLFVTDCVLEVGDSIVNDARGLGTETVNDAERVSRPRKFLTCEIKACILKLFESESNLGFISV